MGDEAPESRGIERPVQHEVRAAFTAVLGRYGERYQQTKEGILITPRLYFDNELRWNYTTKK